MHSLGRSEGWILRSDPKTKHQPTEYGICCLCVCVFFRNYFLLPRQRRTTNPTGLDRFCSLTHSLFVVYIPAQYAPPLQCCKCTCTPAACEIDSRGDIERRRSCPLCLFPHRTGRRTIHDCIQRVHCTVDRLRRALRSSRRKH